MPVVKTAAGLSKIAAYREIEAQLAALYVGERDGLANAANMSAVLYRGLPDLNWAGFYFPQGGEPSGNYFFAAIPNRQAAQR